MLLDIWLLLFSIWEKYSTTHVNYIIAMKNDVAIFHLIKIDKNLS